MTHNLACLKSANPSIPLIQGFLSLSLRPLTQDEQRLPRKPDEDDYLSRAVSMAMALALNDAPRRALRAGTYDLQSEAYHGVLHQTLLYFAIVFSLSAEFQAMRIEEYHPSRMDSIEHAWEDFDRIAISSAHWLRDMSLAMQILIPFKVTTDMRVCIASPIKHDEIFAVFERLIPNIFHFLQAFISHCVVSELQFRYAPRFLLTLCVMPYATFTRYSIQSTHISKKMWPSLLVAALLPLLRSASCGYVETSPLRILDNANNQTVIPIIDSTPFRLEPLSLDILTLRKRWEPTKDFTESLYEDLVAQHNTTLCDDVEWDLLSHDRVVEMNASMAMGYGGVYGKLFMPPSVCQLFGSALLRRDAIGLSDITELVHPEKRWLVATLKAAKLFVQGLGYASQLFAYGCQLYSIVTQQTISSNRVCTWSTFAGLLASYFGTSVDHKTVGSALNGDASASRFNGQAATVAGLAMANETHPVPHRIGNQDLYTPENMHLKPHGGRTILHSHFNFSHADHQLYKRQSFSCSAGQQWEDEGDGSALTECPHGHGQSQGADGFYLGMDWYALKEYDALDWDAGTSGPDVMEGTTATRRP
ncbi:hypothetical protein DB88DRAFT_543312 [Papiliotrema laurentii]|uniref:Uncharacterized protein n=1 Tax=Papiliotrema laurentii TaxID=5418 RepID=A0AAD9CRV6_PAPLA|nr:hypothetical protein DB88DRAFT_543312 [Papiliotrema laurentii]